MKFQTAALLVLAASIEAFTPHSTPARSGVALKGGLSVELPSIESQVSPHCFGTDTIINVVERI